MKMAIFSGLRSHLFASLTTIILFYISSALAQTDSTVYPISQISDGQIQAPTGVATGSLVVTFTPGSGSSAATATLSSLPASLISAIPSSNVTATAPVITTGPVPTSIVLASVPPQLSYLNVTVQPNTQTGPLAIQIDSTLATVPSAVQGVGGTQAGTAASPVETGEEATSAGSQAAMYTGPAATGAATELKAPAPFAAIILIASWLIMG